MKNKRLKLLKLLLEIFEKDETYRRGICYSIKLLFFEGIKYEKCLAFEAWFQRQKPHSEIYSNFYKHPSFTGGAWWWCRTEEGKEQRILFLKHLIEKQSK